MSMEYTDYVRDEAGKPIVNSTHQEAEARCKELGGRLPTMAEAYALRSLEPENKCKENLNEWTQPCDDGDNVRGGSYIYTGVHARASVRYRVAPGFRYNNFGFRCVRTTGDSK